MSLQYECLKPQEFMKTYNAEYADSKPQNLESFKAKVKQYLESLEAHKSQNEKAIVSESLKPFLQSLGFQAQAAYKHKGNSEIDLALLKNGAVEILIEAKKPENTSEMFSPNNPNCKALHECILYYLREREGENQNLTRNASVRYILITDFYQFYLFNALVFKKCFEENKEIQKIYEKLHEKHSLIENQNDFYTELSKILDSSAGGGLSFQGTTLDLRNDKHLGFAHKILNRNFLHHEFTRDSNALNPKFYFELLHILGLRESSEKGKILIHLDASQRVSFAKHLLAKIREKSPQNSEDELFESTMSHIIIYLNRILFLKLIEANLLHFNDFDKSMKFLTSDKIRSFKTLRHLFFEVLAKDYENRESDKGFDFLPYLNSSLFMRDEKEILDLSTFDDDLQILPFSTTQTEYKKDQKVAFLAYLFDFLECWDFGKSEDTTSSDKLISSSVLGAMFEKLNGYKEGSFYTPNFITSFMCRESLSKIVCEKFNAQNPAWNAKTLEDIKDEIQNEKRNCDDREKIESKYIKLLGSIRICDPSVGSGHFLVSALNEMIYIYYKLGFLKTDYALEVKDDEIYLKNDNENFAYKRPISQNAESHKLQIALFNLKKSIIENNLFGVDINPNSCNIARLRLWIELLKSAYYLEDGFKGKIHKLQTLPNIDINIKEGNSLISNIDTNITLENFTQNLQERFAKAQKKQDLFLRESLESQIKDTQRKAQIKFKEMRENVESYKNENDKQASKIYKQKYEESYQYLCNLFKRNCGEYIDFHQELEYFFQQYGYINLRDLEEQTRFDIESYVEFFDFHKSINFERQTQREIPQKQLDNLLKLMRIYEDFDKQETFEWRFAFPEILNHNGDFLGFDLVIGNPPYIKEADNKKLFDGTRHLRTYQGKMDIWYHFVGRGFDIVKNQGIVTFIATQNWTTNTGAKNLRNVILKESQILNLVDFGSYMCFDSASIQTMIMEFRKLDSIPKNYQIHYARVDSKSPTDKHRDAILAKEEFEDNIYLEPKIIPLQMLDRPLTFSDSKQAEVLEKILQNGKIFLREDEVAQGIVPNPDCVTKRNITENLKTQGVKIDDEVFVISKNSLKVSNNERKYLKPLFEVEHCIKYFMDTDNTHEIIYTTKTNCTLQQIPNLAKHLARFKEIMDNRRENLNGRLSFFHLHWARDEKFFREGSKILCVRKCANTPIFSYTENEAYVMLSLNIIKTDRINLKFLTGLFNSKLVAFWLRYKGKMQGNHYQVDKEPLLNIPIPKITKQNQKIVDKIIALVDEILKLKVKDSTTNTSDLESQIDSLVYQLYDLTDEEIKIVESK